MIGLLMPPVRWLAALSAALLCVSISNAEETSVPPPSDWAAVPPDVRIDYGALSKEPVPQTTTLQRRLVPPPQPIALPVEVPIPTKPSDLLPPKQSAFGVPGQPPVPATQTIPKPYLTPTTPAAPKSPATPSADPNSTSWNSEPSNDEAVCNFQEADPDESGQTSASGETQPEPLKTAQEQPPEDETSTEQPNEEESPAEAPGEEQPAETAPPEEQPEPDPNAPAPEVAEGGVRIVYPPEEKGIPTEAYPVLDELADRMSRDDTLHLEVKCYAAGEKETEGKARRLSLVRCLAIRQYFIEKDIRSTRMNLRALGFRSGGQPVDRVDILPAPEGQ